MSIVYDRRSFLKTTTLTVGAGALPMTLVDLAFGKEAAGNNFSFAYISDSHIQHIKGTQFVRNWDRGLIRAVAETNLLTPRPDFVIFGGDLAQLGNKPELDHGAQMLSKLNGKVYHVMGEHDYYLDLGEYWSKLFGKHYYSFDHKGVHFVVLNSILTYDDWTFNRWPTAEQRMLEMADTELCLQDHDRILRATDRAGCDPVDLGGAGCGTLLDHILRLTGYCTGSSCRQEERGRAPRGAQTASAPEAGLPERVIVGIRGDDVGCCGSNPGILEFLFRIAQRRLG